MDIALIILTAAIIAAWVYSMREREREFQQERNEWNEERKQLLDRIQASSFGEYKQAEIRMEKIKREEPEKASPIDPV